jgi:hypothetical protein
LGSWKTRQAPHVDPEQVPPPQLLPQRPQFAAALSERHVDPPQREVPLGQPHVPPLQTCPPVQTLPHEPQLLLSVCSLVQAVPQIL